jgi:DNA-binding HxlR family transcriptional regulator
MEEKRKEDLLKLLGARDTKQILEFIEEHGKTHYSQMMNSFTTYGLNTRLKMLVSFGLVSHQFERKEKRREWYEMTPAGKIVLNLLREIVEIVDQFL